MKRPKYRALAHRIRRQIQAGELKMGERLPSFAQMRSELGVSAVTLQRVYTLLEQEGIIERQARRGVFVASPHKKRTGKLGLFLHSHGLSLPDMEGSQISMLLSGIREGCHENGLNAILIEDEKNVDLQQLDGIIFYGDILELLASGFPREVPLVTFFHHTNDWHTVVIDDFGGMKMATSHLIERGHRRIAALMADASDITALRESGYRAALREAKIQFQPAWLRSVAKPVASPLVSYVDWGSRQMDAWLEDNWKTLDCTALVAQNDELAIGAMQSLQKAGIHVPDEVSVVGFDSSNLCDISYPRLTSVEVPFTQIGKEAVKVLLQQIEGEEHTPRQIVLPVKLHQRGSIANLVRKGEQNVSVEKK